jgi:hypothetical protein
MQNMSIDAHDNPVPAATTSGHETCGISEISAAESPVPRGAERSAPLGMFRDPAWCMALAAVIALAWFVRGTMLFRGAVPAGMDAGYYAVQARDLLERGTLRWADVPLTFIVDAVLAKCLMIMLGWDIDTATLFASRVVDALAEPMVAIPLFLAAWIFAGGKRSMIPGAIAVGLAITVSAPLLRMVGDFEKQSMAYVFMAGTWICGWIAMRSESGRGAMRWWLVAALMLVMAALTHAGTFAATALGAALMLGVRAVRGGVDRRKAVRAAVVLMSIGVASFGAVWWLAPGKAIAIMKLPITLINPEQIGPGGTGRISRGSDHETSPGGTGRIFTGARGPGSPEGPGGAGGPGGPGGPGGILMGVVWVGAVLLATVILARVMRSLTRIVADDALVFGMLFTAAILVCPIFSGDHMMRLALMVPVPLACIAAYLLCTSRRPAIRILQWSVSTIAAVFLAVSSTNHMHGRLMETISDEGYADLRSWRTELIPGDQAVVAARHGLEFWAAFAMDTHGRWGTLKDSDFDQYERLYVLETRRGPNGPRGGPGPRPGAGPDRGPGPGRGPGSGRGHGPGPGRGPGRGRNPMADPVIPAEALIVKQSDQFTLWEVPKSARDSFSAGPNSMGRARPVEQ